MTTARQIIIRALQKAGILTKTETPAPDEITDGLNDLNAMLSSWANDTLLAFVRTRESFPITGAVGTYSIGVGGNFNTARPLKIISAFVRIAGFDNPIGTILDSAYDNYIGNKSVTGIPDTLLYEAGNPLGTITLFPYPSESSILFLRTEKPLADLTLDVEIDLPPGWERAMIYNLAKESAGDYGVVIPEATSKIAVESKDLLKLNTARNRTWDTPPLTEAGSFNVFTGTWV